MQAEALDDLQQIVSIVRANAYEIGDGYMGQLLENADQVGTKVGMTPDQVVTYLNEQLASPK